MASALSKSISSYETSLPKMPPEVAKNHQILKEKYEDLKSEILEFGSQRTRHLYKGLFGLVANPVAGKFYDWLAFDRLNYVGSKLIDLTLECGYKCNGNGNSQSIIEDYYEQFRQLDEIPRRVDSNHPNFPKIERHSKGSFKSKIPPTSKLLKAEGDNYPELVVDAFPRKVDAKKVILKEFYYIGNIIKVIEEDPKILNIPGFRKETIIVLRSTNNFAYKTVTDELDTYYSM